MAATELGTKGVQIVGQDYMLGMDVQSTAIKASTFAVGTSTSIRNTTANFVGTNLDWSAYRKIALRVNNSHNQPITLTAQIQGVGDIKDITGAAMTVTIPASTTEVLVTSKDFAILEQPKGEKLAIKATAATAPTSGNIVITAYADPYI